MAMRGALPRRSAIASARALARPGKADAPRIDAEREAQAEFARGGDIEPIDQRRHVPDHRKVGVGLDGVIDPDPFRQGSTQFGHAGVQVLTRIDEQRRAPGLGDEVAHAPATNGQLAVDGTIAGRDRADGLHAENS
jgi:hypothetical protein